jgi:hypothetical protein
LELEGAAVRGRSTRKYVTRNVVSEKREKQIRIIKPIALFRVNDAQLKVLGELVEVLG